MPELESAVATRRKPRVPPPRPSAPDTGSTASTSSTGLADELAKVEGRKWLRRGVFALALVGSIGGFVAWRRANAPPPKPKYVLAETTKGDIVESVQSTGQVKPLTEVQIGAQVSGRLTKVYVDFNSVVKAGETLAEIDTSLFGAQVESNTAQLRASEASLQRSKASLVLLKQRRDRARALVREGIGSQADLDAAEGNYEVGVAEVAAATAQIGQLRAQLKQSSTNMAFTRIVSPIDGIVVNRAIDEGQTVAASFQAPVLFVIAQDLRKMRVLADIDEADVGKLKEGMRADVSVDAFPGEKFGGLVSQVRFSPQTVSGVVTYAAVVEVSNPDVKLRPGMTATVSVRAAEAKGVTRVPNAALRFKPSPKLDEFGKPVAAAPLPSLGPGKARLYVITGGERGAETIEPREVDVGITDGVHTELKSDLGAARIVNDETDEAAKAATKKPGF